MVGFVIVVAMVSLIDVPRVMAGNNAYAGNINQCMFSKWPTGVLKEPVDVPCTGSQLCYSVSRSKETDPAQFVSCYNTKTLIPDFTAHIVKPGYPPGRPDRNVWHNEEGEYAPNPQSSVKGNEDNYKNENQEDFFPNWNPNNGQFCSRGHLTPCSDFSGEAEAILTFINTNVAPQWQLFNGGNWAGVEQAVKEYANNQNTNLYVVTGTAGIKHKVGTSSFNVTLRGVRGPRFFWKVVCNPKFEESVVIMAENNIGDVNIKKVDSNWEFPQTEKLGVIELYSLDAARKKFEKDDQVADLHFPPLGEKCKPSKRGLFLEGLLKNKLK